MSEEKTVDFIRVIKNYITVFNLIVLLVVFALLFVTVGFVFEFLDYVPTFSILIILFIVSGLIIIGFYLAKGISKSAIKEITERRQVEEINQLQIKRFNVLHSIEKAVTSSLDLRATLNILLDQVTNRLNIDAASILLLNKQTQILEYVVNKGFRSDALKYTKLKLGESNAGRAAIERCIITIPNLKKEIHDFVSSKQFTYEDFITYFAVPLIAKDQIMGVLELFHRSPVASDPEWLEFLETIANQAAIAIDNASLFDGLQRSNIELTRAYDTTIEGWSHALDLRDKETEGHTKRVAEKTLSVAREIGVKNEELVHIKRGALLHDIGKMGIPDSILLKPGPLTDEEWKIMRRHPEYAYEMLYPIEYLRPALDIPYYHHEKWDGTGLGCLML
jgi:putative nucleotidyltransferase with HDIG domain